MRRLLVRPILWLIIGFAMFDMLFVALLLAFMMVLSQAEDIINQWSYQPNDRDNS